MDRILTSETLISHQAWVLTQIGCTAHMLKHGYRRLRCLHRGDIIYICERLEQLFVKVMLYACIILRSIIVCFIEKLDLEQILDWEKLARLGRV